MLKPLSSTVTHLLAATLLSGCGAGLQSTGTAGLEAPDCSFSSATTCWTVAGRFPRARTEAGDSAGQDLRERPPQTLASRADSSPRAR